MAASAVAEPLGTAGEFSEKPFFVGWLTTRRRAGFVQVVELHAHEAGNKNDNENEGRHK